MASTVVMESIAKVAPTGRPVDLWVSLTDADAGEVQWTDDAGGTWADHGSSNVGDIITGLARGQVIIPLESAGPVNIQALRVSNGDRATITINFFPFDNPDNSDEKAYFSHDIVASAQIAPPIGFPDLGPTNDNTIQYTVGVFYFDGQPIEGAEVDWYFSAAGLNGQWRNDDLSPPATAKKYAFAKTLTDANGLAKIRAASIYTGMVLPLAKSPGFSNAAPATSYFLTLDDGRPDVIWDPVGVDLNNGVYTINQGDRTFAARMPNITGPWAQSPSVAWLYMEGAGNHLVASWESISAVSGMVLQLSNALLSQVKDAGKDDNKIVLYVQQANRVSVSYLTQFDVDGANYVNAPDPTVTRDVNLPVCLPDPYHGQSSYITPDDVANGLVLKIDSALPTKYKNWQLFFNYYLNGYKSNAEYRDFKTRPDPGQDGNKPGITVSTAQTVYTATLESPYPNGIGPDSQGHYGDFWCEYYLRPAGAEHDPSEWVYSPYPPAFKMNT